MSTLRQRSSSRDRSQERTIPKEGENLLERLTVCTVQSLYNAMFGVNRNGQCYK